MILRQVGDDMVGVIASPTGRGNLLGDYFVVLLLVMTGKCGVIASPTGCGNLLGDYFVVLLLVMTGKCGVIANEVWQSVERLLRRFTPRNDIEKVYPSP